MTIIEATIAKAYNEKGINGVNEITKGLCKMVHMTGIADTAEEANSLVEKYILSVVNK